MDQDLILTGTFASISPANVAHPGLRTARIIYCDDQPNSNGFGVEYEDFPQIKETIVGTPIKMKFLGAGVSGHRGSIPIGHIKAVEEIEEAGVHKLIVDAVLFADDYPDEVEYLVKAFAEGKAPGVSFEVSYRNSILKNGVNWIKGLVARAATFVSSPAYGNRTALLALASDKTVTTDDLMQGLSEIVNKIEPKNTDKGGSNRMEEELKKANEALAEKNAEITRLNEELTAKSATITTLEAEKETLNGNLTAQAEELATFKAKDLVSSRAAKLAEAGITVEIKPERLSKMDEEAFAEYLEDLKAVATASAKTAPATGNLALASARTRIPRFDPSDNDAPVSVSDLKTKLGRISRSYASAETE